MCLKHIWVLVFQEVSLSNIRFFKSAEAMHGLSYYRNIVFEKKNQFILLLEIVQMVTIFAINVVILENVLH